MQFRLGELREKQATIKEKQEAKAAKSAKKFCKKSK